MSLRTPSFAVDFLASKLYGLWTIQSESHLSRIICGRQLACDKHPQYLDTVLTGSTQNRKEVVWGEKHVKQMASINNIEQ